MSKTAINIHHTAIFANAISDKQFDAVNRAHYQRFGAGVRSRMGYYGGYHYLIERDGEVRQYRYDDEVGAHNNSGIKLHEGWLRSANYYAIGVCFAGNMSTQDLTPEQMRAGLELIERLQKLHSIEDSEVKPHRHYKATQCPGLRFPPMTADGQISDDVLGYLRESVNQDKFYAIPDWARDDWEKASKAGFAPKDPFKKISIKQLLREAGITKTGDTPAPAYEAVVALMKFARFLQKNVDGRSEPPL